MTQKHDLNPGLLALLSERRKEHRLNTQTDLNKACFPDAEFPPSMSGMQTFQFSIAWLFLMLLHII